MAKETRGTEHVEVMAVESGTWELNLLIFLPVGLHRRIYIEQQADVSESKYNFAPFRVIRFGLLWLCEKKWYTKREFWKCICDDLKFKIWPLVVLSDVK